ncbi:histone-lysine N-methyltransferase SETMAR [Trichonephila clavipes]|nr:histone-lysine N-methyltransferase SETMAR [Trichonephila clavipes]
MLVRYFKGIVLFELKQDNAAIYFEMYCHQLDKLNDSLNQKKPELINKNGIRFQKDKARLHTSFATRKKLLQVKWDIMPYPPYSLDLAHLLKIICPSLNKIF